jgi:hypothetical protein
MNERTVFLFLMIRGYMSSVTDKLACERIRDSITIHSCLFRYQLGSIPARSTIHENIQAVSMSTKERILALQHRMVIEEGLDDFSELTLEQYGGTGEQHLAHRFRSHTGFTGQSLSLQSTA